MLGAAVRVILQSCLSCPTLTVVAASSRRGVKKNRFFGAVVLLETVSSMPSSLRPGVLDYGQPLWESDDLGRWADALERYEEAVAFKAARSPNKTTKGLKNLDKWVRDWRPSANGISADELQRCVEWKLKRGKFRPLMAQVASNSDAVVRGASAEAFTAAAARQTGGTGAAANRRSSLLHRTTSR